MIKHYQVLHAICDEKMPIEDGCWDEIVIALDPSESRAQAIHFIETLGWEVDGNKCICPFCSKGIYKEDVETELEKEERSHLKLLD